MTATQAAGVSASPEAVAELRRLLAGVRLTQAVSVAATLGVADVLAAGPRPVDDIAAEVGAQPAALYRLLRLLAAAGVFREDEGRAFSLTEVGAALRSDATNSARAQAEMFGRPHVFVAWANLEHSIRTGENAFAATHGVNDWTWLNDHPTELTIFNRAMASISGPVGPALASAYAWGSVRTVADIGGGTGTLLAAVLGAHPNLRGILFDQPEVVAQAGPILAGAGVADRVEVVGGDFFATVPRADVYVMKSILHDWRDEDAIRILGTIRGAASPSSRLVVVERVLGGPNDDLEGKLMDLHMLVMPGGLERTLDEWRGLFAAGGWALAEARAILGVWKLIEGRPGALASS
jgi:O-methyltransferase/methyltransferase family protein